MKYVFSILFLIIIVNFLYPQSDTTITLPDSLSILNDTSHYAVNDINEIINYSALDSVVFDLETNKMLLYNNAEVTYKDLKLNSGLIVMDRETQVLKAYGIPYDSAGSIKTTQTPLMYQGSEKYEGSELSYNFRSTRGIISMGYSDADVGYYFGEKIKKVTPDIFFIKNGLYTTSTDKIDPEYYFYSPKMKLMPGDKIVAQSVFLYIEGVPVFWIPFAVIPNKTGRSSGLIIPRYGNDGTYGLYLANAGYFWAINDYLDIAATATVFSKGRYDFSSRFRYVKKYLYSGNVEGMYSIINIGEDNDPDKSKSDQWAFNLNHNQQITPTMSLSGNLSFASGKTFYVNSTNSLPDLLRQNLVSNITLSKYWEDSPFSFNLNYYRDQNLINGDVNEKLPFISFNVSETYPFRKENSLNDKKLYEYFSYSYNGSFLYNRTKISGRVPDEVSNSLGALHRINLNFSPTFKYFNIRPFFNYTEIWYNKYIIKYFNPYDSSTVTEERNAIKSVRFFNTGISVNTKLIGIFTPHIGNITGIKHTLTPSISYNFTPDFSQPGWGYYGTYTDFLGRVLKYSYYENGIFGSAPFGESQSINFQLGNLFEIKTRENDSLENKFQLFNFNIQSNYNFAADSLKWSEIFTDFRTQIGGLLNIAGNATFNLYKFDPVKNTRVNTYLIEESGKLAELSNFNINISSSYSFGFSNADNVDYEQSKKNDSLKIENIKYKSPFEEPEINVPVSGSINYNFGENRQNPYRIFKTSNINGSLTFSPTSKWRFSFSASYDLINKQINAPYITAYRDLNSWEINFNWYPIGAYRGFFFEVRIKAPQLQDLKLTKQTNTRGVY